MNKKPVYHSIPQSRIASFDVYAIAQSKHHVAGLLEFDVTEARHKLKELKRNGENVSFTAWILKMIATTLEQHPETAAFKVSRKKLVLFPAINISMVVEKEIDGKKVPIPMVIQNANQKSIQEIWSAIEEARNLALNTRDIVINRKAGFRERMYYRLPGFLRRTIWRIMLGNPKLAYKNMGNVSVTSVGMIGNINGWFLHRSVHPVSFGIGAIIKKPLVVNNTIQIREVMNVTVLLDHDVVDGAPMVRFIKDLTRQIESGTGL